MGKKIGDLDMTWIEARITKQSDGCRQVRKCWYCSNRLNMRSFSSWSLLV